MKKIIILSVFLILITMIMCSCNKSLGLGNFEFCHLHYDTHHDSGCVNINKWYESESGIEICTPDNVSMFFSEGTYILVEESRDCPFCN